MSDKALEAARRIVEIAEQTGVESITSEIARALLSLSADRAAIVEECARVADRHADIYRTKPGEVPGAWQNGNYDGATTIAQHIRALSPTPSAWRGDMENALFKAFVRFYIAVSVGADERDFEEAKAALRLVDPSIDSSAPPAKPGDGKP